MAVARFLSRGGGFLSQQGDASLKDVGLDAICPSHYNRTTADFVHRYLAKTQLKTQQALEKMRHKSLAIICDASPKAKHDAVSNALDHIGLSLDNLFPSCPCAPVDADSEVRRQHTLNDEVLSFVVKRDTGASRWDTVVEGQGCNSLRLILCPDQGGPLYSAYQFLAHHGANVGFIRDELHKLHAHMGRVTSCSPTIKRMTLLSGWLFRAKKSPWNTSNFASTLKEAHQDDVLMELFSRDILRENNLPHTSDAKLNFERNPPAGF
ncbi:unnamed protein product [Symbiodinium microadriaticum]|nr:unnamed protein product [Symbiodinium sp. KB8]CAE7254502.1 unnamed protein product [Symbiodinium microadriaticum]